MRSSRTDADADGGDVVPTKEFDEQLRERGHNVKGS